MPAASANYQGSGATVPARSARWTTRMRLGAGVALPACIALLCIVLSVLCEGFLTLGNITNILRQMSFNMVMAVGMTYVIISGGVDLSSGSTLALASVVTGLVLLRLGVVAGIVAGLATGAVLGALNGLLIVKGKLPPFIATLGTMNLARGIALVLTGGDFLTGFPRSFEAIGRGYWGSVPIPVIIAIAVTMLGHWLFTSTPFGTKVCAVGGNAEACRICGIDNGRVLMWVYTMCGFLSGLVGIVLTARVTSAQPGFGVDDSLMAIAAVLIGGTAKQGGEGSVLKTVLGVLLVGLIANGLNLLGIDYFWQQVGIGSAIVIAVASSRS